MQYLALLVIRNHVLQESTENYKILIKISNPSSKLAEKENPTVYSVSYG